jgi:hypothetical protein
MPVRITEPRSDPVVNGNFGRIDPGDAPANRGGWRRGDHVERRRPKSYQARTGVVIHVNRVGVRRLRVRWADNTTSNVSARSVTRLR